MVKGDVFGDWILVMYNSAAREIVPRDIEFLRLNNNVTRACNLQFTDMFGHDAREFRIGELVAQFGVDLTRGNTALPGYLRRVPSRRP